MLECEFTSVTHALIIFLQKNTVLETVDNYSASRCSINFVSYHWEINVFSTVACLCVNFNLIVKLPQRSKRLPEFITLQLSLCNFIAYRKKCYITFFSMI